MKVLRRVVACAVLAAIIAASTIVFTGCGVELKSIAITAAPTKTEYVVGQSFDAKGMKVTAKYSDDSATEVTDYTIAPKDALELSDTFVTITYEGKTAKQAITVIEKSTESIEVKTAPTKIAYTEGETFQKTGMVVVANYNDGTSAEVTDFTCAPNRPLCVNDLAISIAYGDSVITQPITVADDPLRGNPMTQFVFNGTAELAGMAGTLQMTFSSDNTVKGKLISGDATMDTAMAALVNFPGAWTKTADSFYITMNTFIVDLSSFASFVPDLAGMDPIEITGGTFDIQSTDEGYSFVSNFSAMGMALSVNMSGYGAPEKLDIAAGEKVEAEMGDITGMTSSSKYSGNIKGKTESSNGYHIENTNVTGNVWKMKFSSANAAQNAEIKFALAGYKEGVEISVYLTLKINGVEVPLTGLLNTLSSKYVEYSVKANLLAGENNISLTWKNGADDKPLNFKFDYLTFSTDIAFLNPSLGI